MSGEGQQEKTQNGTGVQRPLKITVVGDGTVGKTCMLISYTSNIFPQEYIPTVFDNYAGTIEVDGKNYSITLWDTAGQEEYERLRPLSYPGTDCFLLCFAIDNRNSFENVDIKWWKELHHHCPNKPIILIGTKTDLREDLSDKSELISIADGRKLKSKIKAAKYVECSAKTREGLETVYQEAVRSAIKTPTKIFRCEIL